MKGVAPLLEEIRGELKSIRDLLETKLKDPEQHVTGEEHQEQQTERPIAPRETADKQQGPVNDIDRSVNELLLYYLDELSDQWTANPKTIKIINDGVIETIARPNLAILIALNNLKDPEGQKFKELWYRKALTGNANNFPHFLWALRQLLPGNTCAGHRNARMSLK